MRSEKERGGPGAEGTEEKGNTEKFVDNYRHEVRRPPGTGEICTVDRVVYQHRNHDRDGESIPVGTNHGLRFFLPPPADHLPTIRGNHREERGEREREFRRRGSFDIYSRSTRDAIYLSGTEYNNWRNATGKICLKICSAANRSIVGTNIHSVQTILSWAIPKKQVLFSSFNNSYIFVECWFYVILVVYIGW